ncbi:MAG: hypothetical protein NVS9B7_19300 [Flavisolibacter sp.]
MLTHSEEQYLSATVSCSINYSDKRLLQKEIFIHPINLLFETSIHPVETVCFNKNHYKAFFKTEGDVGFDLWAAIFFLLTRYEEYLPFEKDFYGRYGHQNSLAYRENFLHLPLVNIWLEDFRKLLSGRNSVFETAKNKFSFCPTYDIDIAWAYRNKGFIKNMGAIVQLFFKGHWKDMEERILVLQDKKMDPYEAYPWMEALHSRYHLHPIYFFLMARSRGKYDKNTAVDARDFKALIKGISAKYRVGLHPSWASVDRKSFLVREKQLLENYCGQKVMRARQHYIRIELPGSYQKLIALGFSQDYSMGYGDINGFRASISTPFHWYDLQKDQLTNLLIYPFCFMDTNAFFEQNYTVQQAEEELMEFKKIIYAVHGTMITIWHNNFLGEVEALKGWKEIYERFIASLETY